MAALGAKETFTTALQAAFDKQFSKKDNTYTAEESFTEFCKDFSSALFTLLQNQTVTLDKPLTDLFVGAVPVPEDGGAAINTAYMANAEGMDNQSKVTLT